MKDEEIVMSLENELNKGLLAEEQNNLEPEVLSESEPQSKETSFREESEQEKKGVKDLFKMLADKLISVGKSVSNFIAYVTTPKEIKKMIYDEAAKEAKMEAKKETIETRKYKMDIVRDEKKKDIDKLRDLSKLAHSHNRTISLSLNNGGILQFESVAKGVSVKYAEPHLKPGTQDVIHDFAPIGGALFRSYNSEKIDLEDFSSVLKVISYERGFNHDLIKESSITNISNERITEEEISTPEPMTETQTNQMNQHILENDYEGMNQMIDQFYQPTMGEQPFFSERYPDGNMHMSYAEMQDVGIDIDAYIGNNYSDQEISLEGNSAITEYHGFADREYDDEDEER